MNLADIITLAKQGYKPNDIKELINIAESVKEVEPAPAPAEPEPVKEAEAPKEPEPDYKSMYEESQAALKKAQIANTKTPAPEVPKRDDEKELAELVRSFM